MGILPMRGRSVSLLAATGTHTGGTPAEHMAGTAMPRFFGSLRFSISRMARSAVSSRFHQKSHQIRWLGDCKACLQQASLHCGLSRLCHHPSDIEKSGESQFLFSLCPAIRPRPAAGREEHLLYVPAATGQQYLSAKSTKILNPCKPVDNAIGTHILGGWARRMR